MQNIFLEHVTILACPGCGGQLRVEEEALTCHDCPRAYRTEDGIPLLFHPHNGVAPTHDVTDVVRAFYEENPFPNYDDLDSRESLSEKANKGMFAGLLDEQIPGGAYVLEAGCGTGQLSNFLGMHWNRRVFGSDLCLNSLRLAKGFRDRCEIQNVGFLQMNLFRPSFQEGVFDLVICNGVLHHTSDPLGGFLSLSRLVKPQGVMIIGLYNRLGRLPTDARRFLFRLSRDRFRFLDAHLRNRAYNEGRKRAWFMDQYKHPHESKHSYGEVIGWLEANGFEFLFSIPKIEAGPFSQDERLFDAHDKGTKLTRLFTEMEMLLRGGVDGGLFIVIGRKVSGEHVKLHKSRNDE